MATVNKSFRVKNGLTVEGGSLYPVTGTTSIAPIIFTSGTNLSTAAAGAFEFDGTRFYLTPSTTRQGIALTDSTGVTLVSTITGSSLTSVGTLTNLTVTNPISGSVTGSAGNVGSSFIIKADTGTTEGTDLYTFNGSTAKTLNIVAGTNITITKTAGQWSIAATGSGNGTVQSVSVVSANGFAGTVATATSTPAITLTTSVTGVLKGNGTAISAATAATSGTGGGDYVAPATTINVGTTSFALNRASASQSLTGVSIDGSAGSVANALTFGTGLTASVGSSPWNGSAAATIGLASGVIATPGTYPKVTVDTYGRVTSGTTLSASDIPTLGSITNAGAIGITSGLVIVTGASGVLSALAAGTTGQYLQYNGTWSTPPNYYPTAVTAATSASPTTNGPTLGLTMNSGTVTTVDIPAASATVSGAVTTGSQTFAGVKTFNNGAVFSSTTTVPTPVNATDAANKAYVDNVAQGVNAHDAVQYATTTTLAAVYAAGTTGGDGGTGVGATITFSATGTTSIDAGANLVLNDRVLVKDGITADAGTTSKANGIYYVSTAGTTGVATVLTRALDYDNSIAGDIVAGDLVYVLSGTTNGTTQWIETATGTATTPVKGIKIGTDSITFTQFSGANATTAGAGLIATGNVFNVGAGSGITVAADTVAFDTTAALNTAITGVGTLTSGTWNAGIVAGQYGGTGVANTGKTITLGGNLTTSGAFATTLTATAATNVTLPTTGTLATLAGTEALTNKTLNGLTVSSSTGTLTVANGSTLATSGANSLTLTTTALTNATLPSGTVTLVDLASTQALTNKTISGLTVSTTTGTLTLANGSTLATSGAFSTTLTATAATNVTLPTTGTLATVNGALGTPASVTLTNGTGLPISTGVSGLGTGVATFLATPTSANLATAITDETGTGTLVFSASPALTGTVTLNAIAGSVTASGSTTGTTALTLSTVYSVSTYTGGEFLVKAVNGTNLEIIKVLVISDGTNFYVTQYGDVQTSAALVTVDFSYTTTNVNMVVTPVAGATGTTSVKVAGTLLAV
jgi:hypothetical protein